MNGRVYLTDDETYALIDAASDGCVLQLGYGPGPFLTDSAGNEWAAAALAEMRGSWPMVDGYPPAVFEQIDALGDGGLRWVIPIEVLGTSDGYLLAYRVDATGALLGSTPWRLMLFSLDRIAARVPLVLTDGVLVSADPAVSLIGGQLTS
jgi:hypothetical protein